MEPSVSNCILIMQHSNHIHVIILLKGLNDPNFILYYFCVVGIIYVCNVYVLWHYYNCEIVNIYLLKTTFENKCVV